MKVPIYYDITEEALVGSILEAINHFISHERTLA